VNENRSAALVRTCRDLSTGIYRMNRMEDQKHILSIPFTPVISLAVNENRSAALVPTRRDLSNRDIQDEQDGSSNAYPFYPVHPC
jgi:hypothetical protein